jgi:DNA repair photolyase
MLAASVEGIVSRPGSRRGAGSNPPNRFEQISLERDADWDPEEDPLPRTQFLRDRSSTIIAYNQSPDVGFEASINAYRGCEHGCIYCYARPFHEYLGFSSGLDFESRIMVKEEAPKLLRQELSSTKWKPKVIAMSGVTDCYQPIERRLKLTRGCLEVLAEFRNPVAIVTKNLLVTRDIDVLSELARHRAVAVLVSLTTLDTKLRNVMEPRTSPPSARLAAIKALSEAGIPAGALLAPVIPGLTDHEIPALVQAAAEAGACRRLCHSQAAPRGGAFVRTMAGKPFSREKGQGAQSPSGDAARQTVRVGFRQADARGRHFCRASGLTVRGGLPQAWVGKKVARAFDCSFPASVEGTTRAGTGIAPPRPGKLKPTSPSNVMASCPLTLEGTTLSTLSFPTCD